MTHHTTTYHFLYSVSAIFLSLTIGVQAGMENPGDPLGLGNQITIATHKILPTMVTSLGGFGIAISAISFLMNPSTDIGPVLLLIVKIAVCIGILSEPYVNIIEPIVTGASLI